MLHGGESLNLDLLQLIGGGVHLGNDDALVILVFLSEFVPNWSQLLAMSAPWSIEFNKDILFCVHGNLVEVLAHQNLDSFLVPILRNLLGHEVLLQVSSQEVGDKLLNVGGIHGVVLGLELCHLLSQLDGSEGGQLTVNNSEELQDSLVVFFVSVGGREEEEVRFDLSGEDLLSSFVVEVNNQWKSLGRHEQGNCFLSQTISKGSLSVIK